MNPPRALLICDNGTTFTGEPFGAVGHAIGELRAVSAMTGYQETLSSGTYAGSVLLFTTPHVGNTGMNDADADRKIHPRGVIVRERPRVYSNWRAERSLEHELVENGVVGITGIDTRALRRLLREAGTLRVGIFSGDLPPEGDMLDQVRNPGTTTDALITAVAPAPADRGSGSVAVVDLGSAGGLLRTLAKRGVTAVRLGPAAILDDVHATGADRVILSGGPGNPADATVALGLARQLLDSGLRVLGLGLGHQILARALGYSTTALPTPHDGTNHPVQDTRTGKVDITSHSHAYTVDFSGSDDIDVTHINLNDGSVEGFAVRGRPIQGLQFHPDPGHGTSDAAHLLTTFLTKDA